MCGGRGTRLDADTEKPLFEVAGRAMVDRVRHGLAESGVEDVYAATSPQAPATRAHLDVPCIETPGDGYVADLDAALADDRIATPVLTVAADLPLLDGLVVDRVLAAHEAGSLAVVVPAALKRELDVSDDTTYEWQGRTVAPTGVNVVGDEREHTVVCRDERLAVNVNTLADARVAERLV